MIPFRALSGAFLMVAQLGCVAAGTPGPPAQPGEEVTTWVRMEQGYPGQTILFRNNTDRAMMVETVEIYDCMNVGRSACQYLSPRIVLPPRAVTEFMTLIPGDPDRAFRFRYRYNFHFVEGA